ncbi:pantoate--beta-alanine ligase [Mariniblastus sp.]|nr:pantoate--beta-alanine ligase [Mariniblastus sp.]
MPTQVIRTLTDLNKFVTDCKQHLKAIGVVPTMGALHAGHLSLVKASLSQSDITIVTIFVNPTQFAPSEDLSAYPRTLESDIQQLEQLVQPEQSGELVVFAPDKSEVYPPDASTRLVPPTIAKKLEGEFRPTHFEGVATVVVKLLNMTQADKAFFGQKDFQQVAVVKQTLKDLNMACEICVCPIIRDPDGLALSSRNVYLSDQEREIALSLNKTLDEIQTQVQAGLTDGFEVITEMRQMLIDGGVDSIDYATVVNPVDLETSDPIRLPVVALIAVHVGKTRLIDNRIIE